MNKNNFFHPYENIDKPAGKVRLIRTLKFDLSKKLEDVESKVNEEVIALAKNGCTIISIQSKQIGFQPIYLFYDITYEPGSEVCKRLLKNEQKKEDAE